MELGFLIRGDRTWKDTLSLARNAEATGWSSLWLPDHFMPFAGDTALPHNEAWTVVSALAAMVPRVRLGHLVSCVNYRHPALLANMAAGVDAISGGRFVLGLGAGSQENEHHAYGFSHPPLRERLERLDEACQVVKSLLSKNRTDFKGRHYELRDAPLEPKGIQCPIPLLVGSSGDRFGLRIVARHADQWNLGGTPDAFALKTKVLDAHCAAVGRDPTAIRRTALTNVQHTCDPDPPPLKYYGLDTPCITGGSEALRDALGRYAAAGCDELVVGDMSFGTGADEIRRGLDRFMKEVGDSTRW